MNVFEKLQKARVMLQSSGLKKSGENTFAKYSYFELGDFMPRINEIMDELKMIAVVSFGVEVASLTVINCEAPDEKIVFTSPMSTADLKGCHPVQNLGAVETYIRRYLYTAAFEIVEQDLLDGTAGEPQQAPQPQGKPAQQKSGLREVAMRPAPKPVPITAKRVQEFWDWAGVNNWTVDEVKELCSAPVESLNTEQLKELCEKMQAKRKEAVK